MKRPVVVTVLCILLLSCSVGDAEAGGVTGVATEWTQIMNHIELLNQYATQLQQLQTQLRQYENQLKQAAVLPRQIFAPVQQDLLTIAGAVREGQALAYSMAHLDQEFSNRFRGYGYSTPRNYPESYRTWAQTVLDTTKSTLKAVRVQNAQLMTDADIVRRLEEMSESSDGLLRAIQVGNQLAAHQAVELQKLRVLMMADLQSKQAFQAQQVQQQMSGDDALRNFFDVPAVNNGSRKGY